MLQVRCIMHLKKGDGPHPCGTPAQLPALVVLATWLWSQAYRRLKNTSQLTQEMNWLTEFIRGARKDCSLFLRHHSCPEVDWVPVLHLDEGISMFMLAWWTCTRTCSPRGCGLQAFGYWSQWMENNGGFPWFYLDGTVYILWHWNWCCDENAPSTTRPHVGNGYTKALI